MLYLFKTHKINLSILPLALAIENNPSQVYKTCRFPLVSNQYVGLEIGELINNSCEDPNKNFRYIDWSTNIDYLNQAMDHADVLDQEVIFGTHRDDQLTFLKNYYTDRITTVGVNYDVDTYPTLLASIAQYHVYMLENNIITPNESDQELLSNSSKSILIDHYIKEFDAMNLVPRTSQVDCDININISDFFNKSTMIQHYTNIGITLTPEFDRYYDTWYNNQILHTS